MVRVRVRMMVVRVGVVRRPQSASFKTYEREGGGEGEGDEGDG